MGRLHYFNLSGYLTEEYGDGDFEEVAAVTVPIRGLEQKDYGGDKDCTLTSITTLVRHYLNYTVDTDEIYNYTLKIGKALLYTEQHGTPFAVIKGILDLVLKHYKLPLSKKQYLLKGWLGYNFCTIKTQIDNMRPVILSMKNDGRDYYKNHTVLIMGYRLFRKANASIPILVVLDNWTKQVSYIDYNKLSTISSINF